MLSYTATHTTLLARLADSQDPGAWVEFVNRYEELVRRFCRVRGVNEADTDDVLQDVLVSLTKAMPGFQYDPAKGKFRSYLKTVVVHAIARKSRQNPAAARLSDIGTAASPAEASEEAQWESEWRRHHLRRALRVIEAEFSHTDRQAFERNALRGESAAHVAEALGISVDHVYQAKSRIARRVSALVHAQVEEEG